MQIGIKSSLSAYLLMSIISSHSYSQRNLEGLSQQIEMYNYLKTENYYMLNKAYPLKENKLSEYEQLLYKSFLAYAYNQPDISNGYINKLLSTYSGKILDSLKSKLYKIQITNHVRLGEYRKAEETSSYIINHYGAKVDTADLADIENSNLIWKALAGVPRQTAIIQRGESIPLKKDKAGLWNVPVTTANNEEEFIFDTGANFSVVCESTARKNKWRTIEAGFEVGTATGKRVRSNLAIADSIVIGHSVFKNVIFLLIPDEDLIIKPNPLIKYVIKGIIGLPVINEFREIEIHNDGFIRIPEVVSSKGYKNFSLLEFIPVLYANVNGEMLSFHFDTGARTSELFKTYLDKYPLDFLAAKTTTKTTGGAGGSKKFNVYQLEALTLGIINELATIKNIPVYKEVKSPVERVSFGNLGQDLFKQFAYTVINFQDMYIELTK